MSEYVAVDIYERMEVNKQGLGGSVQGDIQDILESGDLSAFEDYFGDTDPFEFL